METGRCMNREVRQTVKGLTLMELRCKISVDTFKDNLSVKIIMDCNH